MEPYTIEDIEMLRKKSGLSYREAVTMLDYHNGSLARALIDLEEHGRLKPDENKKEEGIKQVKNKQERKSNSEARDKALTFLQKLYRSRIKIRKGETTICNVSVLFTVLCMFLAFPGMIAGIIASMILGYQFSYTGNDPDFATDSLERMVKSAAQNAKTSVSSVMQTITSDKTNGTKEKKAVCNDPEPEKTATEETGEVKENINMFADASESLREQTKELEKTMDSFFESNPASSGFHSAYSATSSSVPTIQIPVQAETRDGEVTTEEELDGYSSVTIG